MKHIVKKLENTKKADSLEGYIIKLLVKGYFLTENSKIESDSFIQADKPIRDAFELLIKCFNGRNCVKSDTLRKIMFWYIKLWLTEDEEDGF